MKFIKKIIVGGIFCSFFFLAADSATPMRDVSNGASENAVIKGNFSILNKWWRSYSDRGISEDNVSFELTCNQARPILTYRILIAYDKGEFSFQALHDTSPELTIKYFKYPTEFDRETSNMNNRILIDEVKDLRGGIYKVVADIDEKPSQNNKRVFLLNVKISEQIESNKGVFRESIIFQGEAFIDIHTEEVSFSEWTRLGQAAKTFKEHLPFSENIY